MNTLDSINEIVEEVIKRIQLQNHTFEVEASGRHVHLLYVEKSIIYLDQGIS